METIAHLLPGLELCWVLLNHMQIIAYGERIRQHLFYQHMVKLSKIDATHLIMFTLFALGMFLVTE